MRDTYYNSSESVNVYLSKKGLKVRDDYDNYKYTFVDNKGIVGYTNLSFKLERLSHYKHKEVA